MHAASATAGCAIAMFSMSIELIHSPPDLITSLLRSVMCRKLSRSMVATSPVGNQPSTSGESSLRKYRSITHGPRACRSPNATPSHGSSLPSSPTIFHSTPIHHVALLFAAACAALPADADCSHVEFRQRAERRHLGHAPCMDHLHAVVVLEGAQHGRRTGRAADHRAIERREAHARLLHIVEQAKPHGRHAGRIRDAFGFHQFVQRLAVEILAGEHQLRAGQRRGVRNAPCVHMEHRHDRQHGVARRQLIASGSDAPNACSTVERCEYSAPFGLPVVPEV